jgi:polyhydroxyalkanoate synthesis regulator phasin
MKKNNKLYHQLVKKGVINKDILMKEIKNLFRDMKKYNAKEDINKIYENI